MLDVVQKYIPVLTSEAGLCLTAANWQEVRVDAVTYYLDSLLLKPGIELLSAIPDFARYMGWPGKIIVNASKLRANKEGVIALASPYDGSKIKITFPQVFELILKLKPDAVIFPPNTIQHFPEVWAVWDEAITPFIPVEDLLKQELHRPHGVYFDFDASATMDKVAAWSDRPRYISGAFDLEFMSAAKANKVEFIESDTPANLAMKGQVYHSDGIIDVTDASTEMDFALIDIQCACPTCSQKLTRAYLHHLILHTPLLCQRFLIQHNVYYAQRFGGN